MGCDGRLFCVVYNKSEFPHIFVCDIFETKKIKFYYPQVLLLKQKIPCGNYSAGDETVGHTLLNRITTVFSFFNCFI